MNTFSKKVVIGAFALTLLFTVGYANVKIESDGHSNVQIKQSISVTPTNATITIGATEKVTFRMTDYFEINGPFEVQQGAEFTLIRQECPN